MPGLQRVQEDRQKVAGVLEHQRASDGTYLGQRVLKSNDVGSGGGTRGPLRAGDSPDSRSNRKVFSTRCSLFHDEPNELYDEVRLLRLIVARRRREMLLDQLKEVFFAQALSIRCDTIFVFVGAERKTSRDAEALKSRRIQWNEVRTLRRDGRTPFRNGRVLKSLGKVVHLSRGDAR